MVLAIRGVTTADNTSKGDQGIAFNVDGIPISRPAMMGLAFFDTERVEVLRGPQGTLYGKSSTGGVINVISNKPKDSFDGAASAELGSFNNRRGEFMVNVPVSARFAARAAAQFQQARWLAEPSTWRCGSEPPPAPRPPAATNRTTGPAVCRPVEIRRLVQLPAADRHLRTRRWCRRDNAIYNSVRNEDRGAAVRNVYYNPFGGQLDTQNFHNYNGELNLEFGARCTVAYNGGQPAYTRNDRTSSTNDVRMSNGGGRYNWTLYRGNATVDSHELRFRKKQPQRFDSVAGANYYNEDLDKESDHRLGRADRDARAIGQHQRHRPGEPHRAPELGGLRPGELPRHRQAEADPGPAPDQRPGAPPAGTFAAGPGPWPDPTGAPCVAPADCIGGANNGDQDADKPTYRIGFDYQVAENQMIYASVATGFKSGGSDELRARAPTAPRCTNPRNCWPTKGDNWADTQLTCR